jgi:hypothetical protein
MELLHRCCERLARGGRDRSRSFRLCSSRRRRWSRARNCHILPILTLSNQQGY